MYIKPFQKGFSTLLSTTHVLRIWTLIHTIHLNWNIYTYEKDEWRVSWCIQISLDNKSCWIFHLLMLYLPPMLRLPPSHAKSSTTLYLCCAPLVWRHVVLNICNDHKELLTNHRYFSLLFEKSSLWMPLLK